MWPELPPETSAKVEAAVARRNKIEAIKIYREATHCGLKEAKDAIERADALTLSRGSDPIATKTGGPNWLTMILVLIILAIVAAIFLFHNR